MTAVETARQRELLPFASTWELLESYWVWGEVYGVFLISWSLYYAHVVSKAIFIKMYTRVHHQLRRWTAWRHPRKGYHWRMQRYGRRHEGV